ncbi:phenylalanyl-tRNA synthetase beta chain [Hydrogenimonas sp.]|nr:phenylalanyl-tRNA synthetase beta chain [Hydrogenimonas sp.]
MIVTRRWLEEWIDLEGISTEEICRKLNSIGLEVDSVRSVEIPSRIVVGHVISCEKHPDADKLSVCMVDIGSATRQIVCGARNVREGLYVPVATVGAVMPDGMNIKHAKLRGVESDGMICSSTELGLPALGKGILELDDSIGELEPGRELSEYPLLCDDIIEIELTANRGDCLSIHGVARELAVGFNRSLKPLDFDEDFADKIGIGRILQCLHVGTPDVSMVCYAFDINSLEVPLLIKLRLAFIDQEYDLPLDAYMDYAIHTSGVILRSYGFSKISEGNEKAKLTLKEIECGLTAVEYDGKRASIVGVNQSEEVKADDSEKRVVIEASYVSPDIVAPAVKKLKLKTDPLYYRTSRGSEPDLKFGVLVLFSLLKRYADISIYAGESEYFTEREPVTVNISISEIDSLIGQDVEISEVVTILSKLGFEIHKTEDGRIVADIPSFRHDISNKQDVAEEIVRIIGIDNIVSKPLKFTEANRMSESLRRHRFLRDMRMRAVAAGFFESVHYIFCDNKRVKELGFETLREDRSLLNPISAEMDGLRPNLMINMLDSLKRNVSMSKKRAALFEIGAVFDAERNETMQALFVFCGEREPDSVVNAGKPGMMDLPSFASRLSAVIGSFELRKTENPDALMHPYQCADMVKDGRKIGTLAKLHPKVADRFDLPDTFFAQLDIASLEPGEKKAEGISQLTPIYRDLSIVIPQSTPYSAIRAALEGHLPAVVENFYPIDRYVDESLGEDMSLTLRFVIVPRERALEESEINGVMEEILERLQKRCDARLR